MTRLSESPLTCWLAPLQTVLLFDGRNRAPRPLQGLCLRLRTIWFLPIILRHAVTMATGASRASWSVWATNLLESFVTARLLVPDIFPSLVDEKFDVRIVLKVAERDCSVNLAQKVNCQRLGHSCFTNRIDNIVRIFELKSWSSHYFLVLTKLINKVTT